MDDAEFLEGRETVAVYRLNEPDDFDPDAFVLNLGETFGVEETRLVRTEAGEDLDGVEFVRIGRSGGEEPLIRWSQEDGVWGYVSAQLNHDDCLFCERATISENDALERAQALFARTGTPVEELEWEVESTTFEAVQDVPSVRVTGFRTIDGQRYGTPFDMYFANGDEVLTARGFTWEPIPRGEVGLLTADEALRLQGILTGSDPVVSAEGAELGYDVEFRRENARAFLVPVWRYDLNEELGLDTSAPAIRPQDLPEE